MDNVKIKCLLLAFIICIILFIIILIVYYFTFYKQTFISYDKISYKVLGNKKDKSESIRILSQLNKDTISIMTRLYSNLLSSDTLPNRIQFSPKAKEAIKLIVSNYNPDLLTENDPIFTIGSKTFTENGKKISMCLRKKNYEFYDYNLLLFVFLHEIAHIGTPVRYIKKGGDSHVPEFWEVFKFLLFKASDFGYIKLIDYSKHPVLYCSELVEHNPVFDESISNI